MIFTHSPSPYINESIYRQIQEQCECETRYFTDENGNNFSVTAPSYCFCEPQDRLISFEVVDDSVFCPPLQQITIQSFDEILKSLCPRDEEGSPLPLENCTTYLVVEENYEDVLNKLSTQKDRMDNPCDVFEALNHVAKHMIFVEQDSYPKESYGDDNEWETRIKYRKDQYYDWVEEHCGTTFHREYGNEGQYTMDKMFADVDYKKDERGQQFVNDYE